VHDEGMFIGDTYVETSTEDKFCIISGAGTIIIVCLLNLIRQLEG